jgi:H+/gluconate symporter-like permease
MTRFRADWILPVVDAPIRGGFVWMYKEYFNLSIKDTFKSWSLMETIIGVMGLVGVLVLDIFV